MVAFLTKKLAGTPGFGEGGRPGQVFCYVNSVFAPGLDEGVGGLWRVSKEFPSAGSGLEGGEDVGCVDCQHEWTLTRCFTVLQDR